jgi:hypothetical protein
VSRAGFLRLIGMGHSGKFDARTTGSAITLATWTPGSMCVRWTAAAAVGKLPRRSAGPVPLEYTIERLTCAVASGPDLVMVG